MLSVPKFGHADTRIKQYFSDSNVASFKLSRGMQH